MTGFIAVRWPTGAPSADRTAHLLRQRGLDLGWRSLVDQPGWTVLADPKPRNVASHRMLDDRSIVIGALFDRAATERNDVGTGEISGGTEDFAGVCDRLTTRCWGAYVALRIDPDDPSRLDIFRDPIGMTECVVWRCGTLRIVTSAPEGFLALAAPSGLAIDWPRVAGLLRFPASVADALPVIGVETLQPGVRLEMTKYSHRATRHWAPAWFARASTPSPGSGTSTLPALTDACIRAWCSCSEVAVAELSGGLDSAIVAAGIVRSQHPVAGWFHYYARDREGDERGYARAVAAHLDLPLHETLRDHRLIDTALMADVPVSLRPNVASISFFHDRDLAARGRALGADTLLTGQGGDALFFQPASPLIAADLWRDRRPWSERRAAIADLAAWSGRSIWSVLGTALRARVASVPIATPKYRVDLVARGVPRDPHPLRWLDGTSDLAPAKQLQILNLAAARAAFGGSWCAAAMTVLHPLMSQPLLEHVLPLSALDLTQGKRDRAMVRAAYVGRLPPTLLERRGKGCLTPFFGRMLAASTPFLRDYLLGGALVQNGVLDPASAAAVLDPDHLMQTNSYTEIFVALLMEHWARAWSDRLAAIRME
ncbi:asparagine synthase-related protein [Sphingomonas sp. NFR15]|uniref:asparagine synthase-related protein n=1 Tax=Sphingomonas sp. NFR15 TaxID=1566282 RepID=UPI00088F0AC9|nr:asparagine synthase-related protein [Sphingomonas sp. NFR15]SDA36911.1 asparagine synthase (glutamine-hydrolysing) [Sphingomonas sp. NFR15]